MARNKYPEITENRIIDTSTKLFMSKGYENTTIQDITNELGDLSKGAIYHHFKSKEEIMDAVNKRIIEQGLGSLKEIVNDSALSGIDKLREAFLLLITSTQKEASNRKIPPLQKNPQLLALYMRDTLGVASDILTDIVEECIKDGTICIAQPHELSQMILLFFNVWINPWIYSWTSEELNNIIVFMKDLLDTMGVPIFSEEIIQSINVLYSLS
ncbi:TetR/AcrR family transcriptional regulator [Clostridium sp. MSJ-4]|uniref:TetR/AcrR family transcriptional regulator n=1 Tax=Clostridium simiarum TaxID=2841506 RepID=A0ABS6EZK8_9CLOT|nr:TetR/AcrR family transcriptional regulator [Clostridium simiarum]MBU5591679.1 TetR/AcrR family transcriptional regulator [Clostridium simiarum]